MADSAESRIFRFGLCLKSEHLSRKSEFAESADSGSSSGAESEEGEQNRRFCRIMPEQIHILSPSLVSDLILSDDNSESECLPRAPGPR